MPLAVQKTDIDLKKITTVITTDPMKSAKRAGLRYVSDDRPGIRRKRVGRGFSYIDADGKRIQDKEQLKRLKAIGIPPALKDVWICPLPHGHLLATGRDEKGRKQYIYHPEWRKFRSQAKFNRMVLFGVALPSIRAATEKDLKRQGLPKEKVLATVVQLLETTLIRVGNDQYAKKNRSFGLTTMRDRHVKISGATVKFEFRGKSGIDHEIQLHDRRLAKIIKNCRDIPGYDLFQYYDEAGDRQTIDSGDVNDYLQEITGEDFTAKDFRTWSGTLLAALELDEMGPFEKESEAKKNVTQAVKNVAKQLGNRPATCRKYYIHPAVIDAYTEGWLLSMMPDDDESNEGLLPEEHAVLCIIGKHFEQQQ